MSTPQSESTLRRALKGSKVLVKRHLQDIAPREALRARRDHVAVTGAVPELDGIQSDMAPHMERLTPFHADYCARIGHPVHAASLELTALVLLLCERLSHRGGEQWVVVLSVSYCLMLFAVASSFLAQVHNGRRRM